MMFPSLLCVLYSMSWVIWNWCELQLSRLGSVPPGKCLHLGDGWVDSRSCVATYTWVRLRDRQHGYMVRLPYTTAHKENAPRNFLLQPHMWSGNIKYARLAMWQEWKVLGKNYISSCLWPWHSVRVPSWSLACRAPHRVLWRLWWYRGAAYMMKTYYWTCNISPTKKSVCCLDVLHQQTLSHHIFSSKLVIYF